MAQPSVVVFVHVHYPDIWAEISDLLVARMPFPFHLVATSAHPASEVALPLGPKLLSARFVPVSNRGRDIRPFLAALAAAPAFDIGLKLHTKKSPQREDGRQWRAALLDSLLPPAGAVADIVDRMRADPRIGLVTPAGFCLSVTPWVLVNAPGMRQVMAALGHALVPADQQDCYFAAGSMFWFRRDALAALASPAVLDLFEPEEGQLDGTIAHAMERLFPVEAARQGKVSLALPALARSDPAMPLPALRDLARRHADQPSTFFPAPYQPALPPGTVIGTVAPADTTQGRRSWPRSAYARLPPRLRMALRRLLRRG